MNADAMSYLDLAAAYLRGDWQAAINSYWSPLYSWLIAVALWIVDPSPYWRFTVLHLVNFGIYLFALFCFSFFMREVIRRNDDDKGNLRATGLLTLPEWAVLSLGYALFIWSSLFLVSVQLESPDLLVAALVYLATGILLRIRRRPHWALFALLGIVLGSGYLAKSVMLPLSLFFFGAAIFATGHWRRALPRVAVTVVFFLVVAGPWIFAISRSKGRFTTGETGRLNYLWAINQVSNLHWQGLEPGSGQPLHPARRIFAEPPAFEFAEPIGGTYPLWYDPTYWYEGSVSHFDLRQQAQVVVGSVRAYYDLLQTWGVQYALLGALIPLYLLARRGRLLLGDLAQEWIIIIPAIGGLGLYTLVNVQGRYVASFLVLLWLTLFSAVRLPQTEGYQRLLRTIAIGLVAITVASAVLSSGREAFWTARSLVSGEDPASHEQWLVAESLREAGLTANDRVAFIGNSYRAFWAHLLGVRVAAELGKDRVVDFWRADAGVKTQLIEAFGRTGVKAIVAETPPPGADLSGWQKLGKTDYYVYTFGR